MKAPCNSGILGILFGLPGLYIGGSVLLSNTHENFLITLFTSFEGLAASIPFIIFSFIFGIWAKRKILDKASQLSAIFIGIKSSYLTTLASLPFYLVSLLSTGGIDASELIEACFTVAIFAILFGSIPIFVIGGIFGLVIHATFVPSDNKTKHHDLQ